MRYKLDGIQYQNQTLNANRDYLLLSPRKEDPLIENFASITCTSIQPNISDTWCQTTACLRLTSCQDFNTGNYTKQCKCTPGGPPSDGGLRTGGFPAAVQSELSLPVDDWDEPESPG